MAQDDDISNAINIARRDATADAIQSKISGLNQNLAGLDLEANVPQFHTGLTQPQIGGAGFIPVGHPQRKANLSQYLADNHPDVPPVVYHSSKADVTEFNPKYKSELSNMGYHFGTPEQANFRTEQYDFNSPQPNVGKYYLSLKNPLEVSHMASFAPDHLAEHMIDINLLTPDHYDLLSTKHDYNDRKIGSELVKILKKNGYDGLKYQNEREGEGYSFVPFDSTQIKSVTGNNGQFDPSNPDITKANGGRTGYSLDGMVKPDNNTIEMPHSLKELQDWSKTHPAAKPMVKASDDPTSILYNERKLDMPNSLEELQNWARMHHASGGSIDHIAKAMHLARKHFDDGGDARAGDSVGGLRGDTGGYSGDQGGNDNFRADSLAQSQQASDDAQRAADIRANNQDVGRFSFGQNVDTSGANFTGHEAPTGLVSYTTQRETTPYEGTPMTAAQDPSTAFGMAYPSLVGVQNTPAGAAALLANLGYESTQGGKAFQPNAISGSGYGLAQWTDPSRQAAFFNAMQPGTTANNPIAKMAILGSTTPGQQLGYAMNEIQQNYPQVAREMATAKSIPTATENIMNRYESPATNESLDARIALANQIARGTGVGSFAREALNQVPSGNSFAAISPSVSSAVRSALGAGRGDVGTLDSSLAKATALNTAGNTGAIVDEAALNSANTAPAASTTQTAAEDTTPRIPVLSTEDPALIAAYNAKYGLSGPKNTIADMALGQRAPNITTDNPLINTVQGANNFLTNLFTPNYNLGSDQYNKISQNPEPPPESPFRGHGGGQQPIPYIPPVETAAATTPVAPMAAYVPQTPYIPPANAPYASLGANFVDPRMYQNPLFSQLLASGGKVHGNNAMGNALRMAMGYKP